MNKTNNKKKSGKRGSSIDLLRGRLEFDQETFPQKLIMIICVILFFVVICLILNWATIPFLGIQRMKELLVNKKN